MTNLMKIYPLQLLEQIKNMILEIQKVKKTKLKKTPQNTKNLNSGSYDKFEENIPSPTFLVD